MKTFSQLTKKLQNLAIKEFEAQGLQPNLDLAVNALVVEGNFDWNNTLQPESFWYTVAYKSEERAMKDHYIDPSPPAPVKEVTAKKTSTKKTSKKTEKVTKKSVKKTEK